MAIDFVTGNASRYYSVDVTTPIVLPGSGFAVGMWMALPVGFNTIAAFQYFLSTGALNANNNINFFLGETSNFREIFARARSGPSAGEDINNPFASNVGVAPDGVELIDHLLVFQGNGSEFQLYWVPADGTVTAPNNTKAYIASTGDNTVSTLILGSRTDFQSERYYQNVLSEVFMLDRILTNAEIENLATRKPITDEEPSPLLYLRFISPDATISDLSGNGHTATRVGTGYASYTHPIPTGTTTTGMGSIVSSNSQMSGEGSATSFVTGTGSLTSDNSQISGAGDVTVFVDGVGSFTSGNSQLDGVGVITEFVNGSGSFNSSGSQLSGSGVTTVFVDGTGSFISGDAQLNGTGLAAVFIGGAGSFASGNSQMSGAGDVTVVIQGSGSFTSDNSQISGVGDVTVFVDGVGSFTSGNSQLDGVGTTSAPPDGTGSFNSGNSGLSGVGNVIPLVTGSSAFVSGNAQLNGVGGAVVVVQGTGSFVSGNSSLLGYASPDIVTPEERIAFANALIPRIAYAETSPVSNRTAFAIKLT